MAVLPRYTAVLPRESVSVHSSFLPLVHNKKNVQAFSVQDANNNSSTQDKIESNVILDEKDRNIKIF